MQSGHPHYKYRSQHKKTRTQTAMGSKSQHNHTVSLSQMDGQAHLHSNKSKEESLFHLEEDLAAHSAKCELQFISEVPGEGHAIGKIGGWGIKDQEFNTHVNLRVKVDDTKYTSNLLMTGFRRTRAKTETAYHSHYSQKHHKGELPDQIRNLVSHLGRQKKQKKYSFNQVINLVPEIAQTESSPVKDKQSKPLATALIQTPFGISLKNRKIKGSNFNAQKNIYIRKAHNLTVRKKQTVELKQQLLRKQNEERNAHCTSSIDFTHLLRRTVMNLTTQKQVKENLDRSEIKIASDSPIRHELEQLKNLLKGEHTNYIQIGSSCPIKIQGLVGACGQERK